MRAKLAIYAPMIGIPSETFIKRHMQICPPEDIVVITEGILPPQERTWCIDCPVYVIKHPRYSPSRFARYFKRKKHSYHLHDSDVTAITSFLKEHNVHIFWGHYLNKSWPFIKLTNDLGIRFYVHGLGLDLSQVLRNPTWQSRYIDYRQASGLFVLNKIMHQRLASFGIDKNKIHVIPCGVDVPKTPPVRTPSNTIRCLAVGRMVGKKAPLILLESFRLALQKDQRLYLDYVGDGPLYEQVKNYIDNNGLQDKVTLHGYQKHESVMTLLNRSELFLQHSIVDPETGDEEGMPVAILEAMAHGLPVISTKHAGIPEAVSEDKNGYLVEEGDAEKMADQIVYLADNPSKRMEMGECGRKTVQLNFTSAVERNRLIKIMKLE